ncbi:Histone-lysine N-methyltransferase SETMAR [Eumeta japonica]|uniref:Histone-lysine N-methyltransferase SETMAR n=1 Tax=Eumeta variegata TaxID=151549 RepID=A0A4C2A270_EUMVA|nr:Histone-lysine N-methyltransferase SETMAR [Eumeta japonica]
MSQEHKILREHLATDYSGSLGTEILAHPPYSPDFATCNFYLFPEIQEKLGGKTFTDAEEAVAAYEKAAEANLEYESFLLPLIGNVKTIADYARIVKVAEVLKVLHLACA